MAIILRLSKFSPIIYAPYHVHELAEADGGRVAVTGDADAEDLVIGEHRPGRNRGHAAMHAVESV